MATRWRSSWNDPARELPMPLVRGMGDEQRRCGRMATVAVTATTDDMVSVGGVSSASPSARRMLVVQMVTQATVKRL